MDNRNSLSATEQAYRVIKARIVSLDLQPGSLLEEQRLADELGVSRTPVREALRALKSEGLVEIIPRKGARVSQVVLSDVLEAYALREIIEPEMARLAAERITPELLVRLERVLETSRGIPVTHDEALRFEQADVEFHDIIMLASGNTLARSVVRDLRTRTQRVAFLVTADRYRASNQEHEGILAALRERDAGSAERAMRQHIQRARSRVAR